MLFESGLGDLIVSLSNGSLSLLRPDSTGLSVAESWHAHDYEPWIAAYDYWNPNIVYSGLSPSPVLSTPVPSCRI